MPQIEFKVAANKLENGMLVDLEGDVYADPTKDDTFAYEVAQVEFVENIIHEGVDYSVVNFIHSGGYSTYQFPANHELQVVADV